MAMLCLQKQNSFLFVFHLLSITNLHWDRLAVAVMDNPELVEWVVVSAFGDGLVVVAAAAKELVVEGRVPITVQRYSTIDLHDQLTFVLYLRWLWIGWKWYARFIVVISWSRWKVLITTSRRYICIHVGQTG